MRSGRPHAAKPNQPEPDTTRHTQSNTSDDGGRDSQEETTATTRDATQRGRDPGKLASSPCAVLTAQCCHRSDSAGVLQAFHLLFFPFGWLAPWCDCSIVRPTSLRSSLGSGASPAVRSCSIQCGCSAMTTAALVEAASSAVLAAAWGAVAATTYRMHANIKRDNTTNRWDSDAAAAAASHCTACARTCT